MGRTDPRKGDTDAEGLEKERNFTTEGKRVVLIEHRIKLEPGCEKEKRFAAANRQLSADVVVKMSDWQAPEERTRGELKPERAAQRFRDEPAMERGRREKPMVERRLPTKLPGFDGTSSWEAFNAQMGVMEKLCGWTPEEKAQQLTAALRGEAQMVLLNLAQE
ncbi:hypothetical protein EOD39_10939 [Acipenser ruthenus]|uniref:Uncharacterized protein n=1 Tax=Acipenser ruthenus TaxID=7906 RepID=A0A444TWQ2_ACIRT|nr:hypothetical protein EOD39_10939 [Acipenser ruthenus]